MDTGKFSDRGYRLLFSHPRMVEDLLRSFVSQDLVREFDFSTLKRMNGSYVTKQFRASESDLLWEVTFRGRPAFIYILIEFQSTVDRFMAPRLLSYMLLFYLDLLKRKRPKRPKSLPSVFPVVLYNGDKVWDAPLCLEELIDVPVSSIGRYIPRFTYYKIAENEFSAESLAAMESLAAQMFRIDTGEVEDLPEIARGVIEVFEREASVELKRDFRLWLCRLLRKRGLDVNLTDLGESEVYPMLLTKFEKHDKELLLRGRQEGEKRGEKKGRLEALKLLLEVKFGQEGRGLWGQIDAVTDARRLEKLIRLAAVETDLTGIVKALNSRAKKTSGSHAG